MEQPLLLDRQNVREYFDQTALPQLPSGSEVVGVAEVTENSYVNWVFALHVRLGDNGQEETLYVRQSRYYVKAHEDLQRDPGRVDTEAKALAFIDRIVPGVVPKVIRIDRTNSVLILSDIKLGGQLLADELAAGRVHPEAGPQFGSTIGEIQKATFGLSLGQILGDASIVESSNKNSYLGARTEAPLRLYPEQTQQLLEDSAKAARCFVMGDLSPKNIFVEEQSVRFLDLERTSTGDPAYDPAYVITHLLIDANRSLHSSSLEFINGFMQAYLEAVSSSLNSQELDELQNRIIRFVGFSILHRTQGIYFVSYSGQDKDSWQQKAGVLLGNTNSTSVVNAITHLL
jgi:5-methylthioribose kinase